MNRYYLYEGKKIHYSDRGKGEAVVFLHGFTENIGIWNEFSGVLCKSFRVICIDLPGHGYSENIGNIHTMDLMGDCVINLLEELKVFKFVLIGHSMGGYVSLAIADRFSEKVKGLALFHSTAYADSPETRNNRIRTNELIKNNHFNFLCDFIPGLFTVENQKKLKNEIQHLIAEAKKMSVQGVLAANMGMAERPDRTHVLKNLKVPILFICGKQDVRVIFEKVLEQIAIPQNSVALIMSEVAHMGYLEAKEKTLFSIKSFIAGCN